MAESKWGIDVSKLTNADVGRWVEYNNGFGGGERGRIKSWKGDVIFVVYKCGGNWYKYDHYTGEGTKAIELRFVEQHAFDLTPEAAASTDRILNSLAAIDGKDLEAKQLVQVVAEAHGLAPRRGGEL